MNTSEKSSRVVLSLYGQMILHKQPIKPENLTPFDWWSIAEKELEALHESNVDLATVTVGEQFPLSDTNTIRWGQKIWQSEQDEMPTIISPDSLDELEIDKTALVPVFPIYDDCKYHPRPTQITSGQNLGQKYLLLLRDKNGYTWVLLERTLVPHKQEMLGHSKNLKPASYKYQCMSKDQILDLIETNGWSVGWRMVKGIGEILRRHVDQLQYKLDHIKRSQDAICSLIVDLH